MNSTLSLSLCRPIRWNPFTATVKKIVWHHSPCLPENFIPEELGKSLIFAELIFKEPIAVRRYYVDSTCSEIKRNPNGSHADSIVIKYHSVYVTPWVVFGSLNTHNAYILNNPVIIGPDRHDSISFDHPPLLVTQVGGGNKYRHTDPWINEKDFLHALFDQAVPKNCPVCGGETSTDHHGLIPNLYCKNHDPKQNPKDHDFDDPITVRVRHRHASNKRVCPDLVFDRPIQFTHENGHYQVCQEAIHFFNYEEFGSDLIDGAQVLLTQDQKVGRWPHNSVLSGNGAMLSDLAYFNYLGIKEIVTPGKKIGKPSGTCPVCAAELSSAGFCTRQEPYYIYDPRTGHPLGHPHYYL